MIGRTFQNKDLGEQLDRTVRFCASVHQLLEEGFPRTESGRWTKYSCSSVGFRSVHRYPRCEVTTRAQAVVNQAVADGLDGRGCGPVQGRAKVSALDKVVQLLASVQLGLVALRMPIFLLRVNCESRFYAPAGSISEDRAAKVGNGLSTVTLRTVSNHCATSLHPRPAWRKRECGQTVPGNPRPESISVSAFTKAYPARCAMSVVPEVAIDTVHTKLRQVRLALPVPVRLHRRSGRRPDTDIMRDVSLLR